MLRATLAAAAVPVAIACASPAHADIAPAPPYIDHTEWVHWADLPGLRQQFVCHWQLAEFAQPAKTSWNLEPWRPVVDDAQMLTAGCNPGGIQEPF